MAKRLQGWKSNLLSQVGRSQLIQTTSSAIPNYFMNAFFLPKKIHKQIDKTNRNFYWGHSIHQKKIHHISWKKICKPKKLGGLGLRSSESINHCYMAKLKWNVLKGKKNLSTKILTTKYGKHLSKNKHNSSFIRKSMNKDNNILKNGTIWRIGNGKTINLWHDNWLDSGPLRNHLIGPLNKNEETTKLETLTQNWPPINIPFLHEHASREIASIFISLAPNTEDILAWKFSKDGDFSIKSAYNSTFPPNQTTNTNLSWIWKTDSHPRENHFLWQTYHKGIPTAKKLNSINCLPSPICRLCNSSEETIIHLLRDCNIIKPIWLSLGVPNSFFQTDLQPWLRHNSEKKSLQIFSIPWNTLFTYIIRNIWLNRNQLIFRNKPFLSHVTLRHSIQKATEHYFLVKPPSNPTPKETVMIKWTKPSPPFLKLNVDGSCSNNHMGSGGLIRDEFGNHILSYCHNPGYGYALMSELWALQIGLTLAINMNIQQLEIETDSSVVKQLMEKNDLPNTSKYFTVISNCRSLLTSLQAWKIQHCFREANRSADALANHGRQNNTYKTTFHQPPPFLIPHLLHDQQQTPTPRSITINQEMQQQGT
ncbi:reverse transcriptase [Senna tora]|uniref:Reverse transcriptase n=1 Tax=Senna tora TaxID=362788 RepID=A0A835CIM8_9FABA|nr:reverse transcriptase [Senna tora]